ncbi:hypothetical protein MAR_005681 [Mya arenaria]|uniref:Uncharacterized protein n=1 Tax=Mya arenaria TaxID=6604 RepID=A0ABY7F435_MYAAR|nr:hypothetical protein MAR_005681 [Mya arenaria]
MANLKQFKIGDTVQIGNKDIVKPLGTYSMYKVHTFLTGDITLAVRHELIKGMPDFRNLFDCCNSHGDFFDDAMSKTGMNTAKGIGAANRGNSSS